MGTDEGEIDSVVETAKGAMGVIVRASFSKKSLCECGFPILNETVPLGTIYEIDMDTIESSTLICGGCKAHIPVKTVHVVRGGLSYTSGLIPLDVFEIDEGPIQ